MRKTKLFLVLLLALLPFVGWAQQNYDGQHVSIKLATGDSIQYNLNLGDWFKPVVQEGKTIWKFRGRSNILLPDFSFDNVESVDFRSFEYDEREVRQALTEFYQALDGDNWGNHENWCSDKPIWEWYGVNRSDGYNSGWMVYPWVEELWFTLNSPPSGKLPECISRMGPIKYLALFNSNIEGEIPAFLGNIYTLETIVLDGNKFTGTIPAELGNLPNLSTVSLENNQLDGPLPETFILSFMGNSHYYGNNFDIIRNNFTGKVPQSIQQHPRFEGFWPGIVIQNGTLDISDLVIPAPTFKTIDINGDKIDLPEIYKKNKYTLLYKWGLWCSISEAFNQKLVPAYKAYKDKGLEVIGIHYDLNPNYDDGLADYVKTHDIPWRNSIAKDWDHHNYTGASIFEWCGTPNVFLVDQNGHIVFNSLMYEDGTLSEGCNRNEVFTFLEKELGPIEFNYYTSTDYSHDGEVVTLQKATNGKGFDLVFVGEGFTDKDLEEGRFDQRMSEALEQFFAYEPYTSLRDRFNVYAVKAVSPNAEFADGCTHAIDVDYSKALEYATKVTDLIPNRPMHVTVVYNNASGGRSFCMMMEDNSYVCYAMDGVSNVLNHEAGGHGIGKLLDEYVEAGNESLTLPEEYKMELDSIWTTKGWGANVDWRSNPGEVKWAKFINNERYKDEKIGVYGGSYLYQFGAYRPTENSMMRNNDVGFNAPSREAIYKRVMQESEGDAWTYNYEEFVEFDNNGHRQFVDALNNRWARRKAAPMVERQQLTAPPVFLKGTWQDALKKNNK